MIHHTQKILATLLCLWAGTLSAQPLEYRVTLGGRGAGLGESAIALQPSPLSVYYNPATLGFMQQGGLLVDYSNLFGAGVYEGVVAAATPLPLPYTRDRQFGFGLMVNFEGLDDSELRYGRYIILAAAGLPVTPHLAVGATYKIAIIESQLEKVNRPSVNGSGTGLDLSMHYRLPFPQPSFIKQIDLAVAGYDFHDTQIKYQPENRSDILFTRAVRGGAAIHLRDFLSGKSFALRSPTLLAQIDDRWHLGGEVTLFNTLALRAGYAHDFGKPGEAVTTFGLGLDLDARAGNVQFDYAYVHASSLLPDRHLFTLFAPMFKGPPEVAITTPEIAPIFASYYLSYPFSPAAQHNSVQLENLANTTITGRFTRLETKWGIRLDEKAAAAFSLQPGERRTVRLPLTITGDVLATNNLSQPIEAKLRFEYTTPQSNKRRHFEKNITLVVHGKNYLTWDELAREAAFITPEDRRVQSFRESVAQLSQNPIWQYYRPLYRAAQFYEALVENGFAYLPDTKLKFDSLYAAKGFDKIKYPGELLASPRNSRRGDCDDLVALYASLLESDNIATAVVGTSDHVLVLFDTGIPASRRAFLPLPDSLLLPFTNSTDWGLNDKIWLPVEVTAIGRSAAEAQPFYEAIVQAAAYIREAQKSDTLFEIVSTIMASNKFPATLPPDSSFSQQGFVAAMARTKNALAGLDQIRTDYLKTLAAAQKRDDEAGLAAGLEEAAYWAYLEAYDMADSILTRLSRFSDRHEWLNNRGNLALLRERYEQAAQFYDRALQNKPDFLQGYLNRILLNQARLVERIGNADSLVHAIQRDSLVICQLYDEKYRDTERTLVSLQGLSLLSETGRGRGQTDTKRTSQDTVKAKPSPATPKERSLVNKAKDFFRHLSNYLNPPGTRVRIKYVAGARGESLVLQATRLVDLLYWSTVQTPEAFARR